MNYLQNGWEQICSFFQKYVITRFLDIGWIDIVDILLLSAVLFAVYQFAKSRRAGRVLIGLLVMIVASLIVTLLRLPALSYMVRVCASAAFFCVVLIFQPEIRDALERIGNSRLASPRSDSLPKKQLPAAREVAEETVDAVFKMSQDRMGALIVFEGLTQLGDYAENGKPVDARITSPLLQNIFYDKAPLHDGALIIRNMRIWMASCVLPSTKSPMDFGNMGTRHRAAVGITEVSDALVIVVSEQTGTVSVAQDGKLLRDLDSDGLTDILMTFLAGRLYLRTKRQEERAARAVAAMEAKGVQKVKAAREQAEHDASVAESAAESMQDSETAQTEEPTEASEVETAEESNQRT